MRIYGHVTGAEITRAYEDLFGDERWRPSWNACWDGTEVLTLMLVPEDVPAFMNTVRRFAERVGPGRSGILIGRPQDALTAHQLTVLARHHPDRDPARSIAQFDAFDKLAAWLGVEAADLRDVQARMREGAEAPQHDRPGR